jgi:hypothetical protein
MHNQRCVKNYNQAFDDEPFHMEIYDLRLELEVDL